MLIKQEALKKDFDDAIILNQYGLVAEGTSSNIFMGQNGILKTPILESGSLRGITRGRVLEIAGTLGIPVKETKIKQTEFMQSSEVFFTNSMIELMPIVEINGQRIGNGLPGIISKLLLGNYRIQAGGL